MRRHGLRVFQPADWYAGVLTASLPIVSVQELLLLITDFWGIHLTGVARTLWQWNAPVSAPTTLSRLENFKLGSRLMQTAWTTWNGYDGLAVSSARPVVIREDGGLGTAGSCVLDAVTAHQ